MVDQSGTERYPVHDRERTAVETGVQGRADSISPLFRIQTEQSAIYILVAGSRVWVPSVHFDRHVTEIVSRQPTDKEIIFITGLAKVGADAQIIDYATRHSYDYLEYPADWDQHGKSAGYIRNAEMGKRADLLLAFWTQQSRGTKNMISIMQKANKPTCIIHY